MTTVPMDQMREFCVRHKLGDDALEELQTLFR